MSKTAQENKKEPKAGRRSFLKKLWLGLGLIALVEFLWICITFLRPRKPAARVGDFGNVIEAGAVDDFEPGSVTPFVRGHFYLTRLKDGGFLAVSRKCTHLGCTVPWDSDQKKFVCPCHSSVFDITGDVISPPAPRALDLYPVFIENQIVSVDTGRKIRRSRYEESQVKYSS